MRHLIGISTVIATTLAACNGPSTMDEQMKQDLEAASASAMVLAPAGGGQRVVSAIEQTGKTQPKVTTSRKAVAPAHTPRPQTPQTAQNSANEPAARVPTSRPAVSPPPPGGYKTVGEVLRNAPFPIKP